MRLSVGTSGFSYPKWRGAFYPEKCKPEEMLAFYGGKLPAVEINNTFYRLPKRAVLESWAESVPEGFRFAIKASRRITHFKRLKEAGEETRYLLSATRALGDRLGVILFQLPPNLKADLPRLDAFLEHLPDGTPAAFEFRHPSWLEAPVRERLAARNHALVAVDGEDGEPPDLFGDSDWGYLRLRRPDYDAADLAGWASRVAASGWRHAFVFFKHEDAGAGPRMAAAFLEAALRARREPGRVRPARRRRAEAG